MYVCIHLAGRDKVIYIISRRRTGVFLVPLSRFSGVGARLDGGFCGPVWDGLKSMEAITAGTNATPPNTSVAYEAVAKGTMR